MAGRVALQQPVPFIIEAANRKGRIKMGTPESGRALLQMCGQLCRRWGRSRYPVHASWNNWCAWLRWDKLPLWDSPSVGGDCLWMSAWSRVDRRSSLGKSWGHCHQRVMPAPFRAPRDGSSPWQCCQLPLPARPRCVHRTLLRLPSHELTCSRHRVEMSTSGVRSRLRQPRFGRQGALGAAGPCRSGKAEPESGWQSACTQVNFPSNSAEVLLPAHAEGNRVRNKCWAKCSAGAHLICKAAGIFNFTASSGLGTAEPFAPRIGNVS